MKIAIIADIHDNLVNLEKCLNYCAVENAEALLCCGDVTNDETLWQMARGFKKQIYLVRGNMEIYEDTELAQYENIKYLGRVGRLYLDEKNIGICHEPFLKQKVLKLGACDYIFYGHTHKPWIEKIGYYRFINPGTLGGVFQRASFAFWDTRQAEPELKVLDLL